MDITQEVQALAFKRAKAKRAKIKQLGIRPEMTQEEVENLTEALALAKAIESEKSIENFLDGQQWYVENLLEFSKLDAKSQFYQEIENAFPELASEDDLIAALEAV